jgi:hypothetical protein
MEPEIEGLLRNSNDLVATFVSLPGEFERQRRDSMVEISDLLGAQQAALVTTLEDSQAQLGPMLDQLRATLESGNALVASADGLATRLGVGEPGDPDQEGFDLAELQETIVRAESATSSLQRLVESIDALLASDGTGSSVERLQAGSQALESLVDHVYQRALTLVAAAAAALLGVLVIYRLIAVRLLGLV